MRGALVMVCAMCAFTINDAFVKLLGDSTPLFQIIFLRGIGCVVFLALLCYATGQLQWQQPRKDWHLILWRTAGELGATYCFLQALFHMPIANVSAILQVLPLSVSLAAALFLGEPLGWRRMVAIAIGFCGVLLIVQPGGSDFTAHSSYALGAVVFVTLRDLAVRKMGQDVPTLFVALIAAVAVTVLGGVGAFFGEWQPLQKPDMWQLGGATTFLILGYITSVSSMRFGDISFVAPFRYTSLVVALILGVLVFGEWPNGLALVGAGIVVATGLFTLYRETKVRGVAGTP